MGQICDQRVQLASLLLLCQAGEQSLDDDQSPVGKKGHGVAVVLDLVQCNRSTIQTRSIQVGHLWIAHPGHQGCQFFGPRKRVISVENVKQALSLNDGDPVEVEVYL